MNDETIELFSATAKYYVTVILSTLSATLLFAFIASVTFDTLVFFALICGALSITVGVFGCVLVSIKMLDG
ncbi:hypothetical protein LCGC14_2193180 [marine sediment metagenome]|uniref:Uncharacterized protein n=1 Tax=marine sediment metagenome TaxID=412755 RepID=A0A0F9E606_9ZZZZ